MNITLTPELRKFVQDKVKTGQFASAAEVIQGALTLLQAEETLTPADIETLRREVEVGLKQADRGEFVEFTAADIKARGRRLLAGRKQALMAKIRRTPQSEVDYLEIWLYVAPENRTAADRLVETFDEKLELLAEFPGLGPSREELGRGIRSLPVGNYLIIYRPFEAGIELLRVLHGSRNLRRIFRRRGRRR